MRQGMSKERRQRAVQVLKMRAEGWKGADIAAHFGVTESLISNDVKVFELERSKEFFAIPPSTISAIEAVWKNIVTLQYKQLLAAAKQPKTTSGLLQAHAKFMRTGCEAISDLIADLQATKAREVEKAVNALEPQHPAQGYVDDLSRKRGE